MQKYIKVLLRKLLFFIKACLLASLITIAICFVINELDGGGISRYYDLESKGLQSVQLIGITCEDVNYQNPKTRERVHLYRIWQFECSVVLDDVEYDFIVDVEDAVGPISELKANSMVHSVGKIDGYIFMDKGDESVYFSKDDIKKNVFVLKQIQKSLSTAEARRLQILCWIVCVLAICIRKMEKEEEKTKPNNPYKKSIREICGRS
ncbi:MAG: hypothetical protein IKK33_00725 [Lachnospiraceae bacterium]|nr:hypothetical protein [Lachnospiraceae bacterium]